MTQAIRRTLRNDLVAIFRAAVAAVDPTRLLTDYLVNEGSQASVRVAGTAVATWPAPTLVVGAGKAAARMAAACEAALGSENVHGEVIVADGCGTPTRSITVTEAGHPLPDERGAAATRRIIELVKTPRAGGTLCLIGGGASSLLVQPQSPVLLEDKIRTTQLLLACGADIGELNCVRKHLSVVKGGGLSRLSVGPVASLLISDVVGDDIGTIGSGPTAPDPTTFADAWAVLTRHQLTARVPPAVVEFLKAGVKGEVPETVKPDRAAPQPCNLIVASNRTALLGAAEAARSLGWDVLVEEQPLMGDTTQAAERLGDRLRGLTRAGRPICVLAGGETTVRVTGGGRGGRNQEFALALARRVAGQEITALSAGSDGIDGPTDAAGAFIDGTTLQRARERGLDASEALALNDSYTFFARLGDLLQCGPTGTNVMDLKVVFIGG